MSNLLNKNSTYVQSLVDFTVDTKPYHSKLTEVAVEYRFEDKVQVKLLDSISSKQVSKATWPYTFFSSGEAGSKSLRAHRVTAPNFFRPERNDDLSNSPGRFMVERDEIGDLVGVPKVFYKRATTAIADAWLETAGGRAYLQEGLDYHHIHGSFQFRISVPEPTETDQWRRWQDLRDEGVMNEAISITRQLALDTSNPMSANRQIHSLLVQIEDQLSLYPNAAASAELQLVLDIINTPDLPRSYEALLAALVAAATPVIAGYTGWVGEDGAPASGDRYVDDALSALTPPAFFHLFSDNRLRHSGRPIYPVAASAGFKVTEISTAAGVDQDEWTFEVVQVAPTFISVSGSTVGFIGVVEVGQTLSTGDYTFVTEAAAGTPAIGDQVTTRPAGEVTTTDTAPLEVWNIIKTNPLAFDRPALSSDRLGKIVSQTGAAGKVTVLDPAFPAGTLTLTATSATSFSVETTGDPAYQEVATVGLPFNDGRLSFTIIAGTARPYQVGDTFLVEIINSPATVEAFDLLYGYDLDGYDDQVTVYTNTDPADPTYLRPLNFAFDTRFTDYNLNNFNLVVDQSAVDGRSFRLVAVPDGAPVARLQKDGTGPSAIYDLAGPTTGVPPDPALTSAVISSLAGDPNSAPDLLIFYASSFLLQYSDDNFASAPVTVGPVAVGGSFSSPSLGISFTLATGSKPFIAVTSDDGLGEPRVEGGDTFAFKVSNAPARQSDAPAIFRGDSVPRVVLHGAGFRRALDARWTLTFTSATTWSLTGIFTSGASTGTIVPGYPVVGTTTTASGSIGRTYRDRYLHFTIIPGAVGAGDEVTFTTFARAPSLLVHGSVSGWQEPATYDKWYWNGKIGFRIHGATGAVYRDGEALPPTEPDYGKISLEWVRPDCPSSVFRFNKVPDGFTVRRDGAIVGFVASTGTYEDDDLTVTLTSPEASFDIFVEADDPVFSDGVDAVVVKAGLTALDPQAGDLVSFLKADRGGVGINLSYAAVSEPPSSLNLSRLSLQAIDAQYIDIDTNGVPIETYSPEAIQFSNWVPVALHPLAADLSPAPFPQTAERFLLTSLGSGQPVGSLFSTGSLNEPVRFAWDDTFFTTYLPLNTRANLNIFDTFLDEKMSVKVSEGLFVLQTPGALVEDAQFNDDVNISIGEENSWSLQVDHQVDLMAAVADGPFTSFLAGFGNLPYDAEDALGLDLTALAAAQGSYDTGQPLVDAYLRAQFLAALPSPSTAEALELETLVQQVGAYLVGGSLAATSLPDFLAALDLDTDQGGTAPEIGIPARGLGVDLETSTGDTGATSISEAFIALSSGSDGALDASGLDGAPLDVVVERTATMIVAGGPPIPSAAPIFTTYAAFETPLYSPVPAKVIEVVFGSTPVTIPTFFIWTPTMPIPMAVLGVVQISPRKFTFSIPVASEIKVAVI